MRVFYDIEIPMKKAINKKKIVLVGVFMSENSCIIFSRRAETQFV